MLKSYYKIIEDKIKEKGLVYVFRRATKKLMTLDMLIIYPIVFILCLVIKFIKPLFFIRFGAVEGYKFGLLSAWTEMNLCEQENGIQPSRTSTFNIYNNGEHSFVCNNKLLDMWKRIIRFYPRSKYFWNTMNTFSFGKDHIIEPTLNSRDVHGLLENTPVHLSFTKEEILQAKKDLSKMSIGEKDKYVLMINRGQRYLDEGYPPGKGRDFAYHSYRNVSINDFMPMAEMLTKKGNFVIRMGHLVSDLMKTKNPKIIEYDHDGFRTELLDVYLGANCRYIVASDTGYLAVPGWNFRKPIVWIHSQLELMDTWLSSWLFIFKKYWLKSEKRFLNLQEILDSGAGRFWDTKQFEKIGIEVINNTSEEISEVVEEMEKRLNGTWKDNEEDDKLQKRFWSYFQSKKHPGFYKSNDIPGVIRSRIGTKFLRSIKNLL